MASATPKQPKQETIQYVGVSELSPEEQTIVNDLVTDNYKKIRRDLQDITNLIVHVKSYQHTGGKKKFSLHLRVQLPKQTFESCHADDFDLPRCLHKAFDDVQNQIHHKLHTDVTRPR